MVPISPRTKEENVATAADRGATQRDMGKPGRFRRLIDYLFGFDFFLSYAHDDGLTYPEELASQLEKVGFKVFLDRRVYVAGDDLPSGTTRRIRMSRKFILLARPHAMSSRWVRIEVQTALEMKRTPIVINFKHTLEQTLPENELKTMLGERIYLQESLDERPSGQIIDELIRGFRTMRQETLRLRVVLGAAIVFGLLMVLAVWQAFVASQAREKAEVSATAANNEAIRANNEATRASNEATRANNATLAVKEQLAEALLARGDSLSEANRTPEALPIYEEARGVLRDLKVSELPAIMRQGLGLQRAPLPLWVQKKHTDKLQSVAISSDGKHALTGGDDGQLHYWHLPTSRIVRSFSTPKKAPIRSVAFSGEGKFAVAVSLDYRTRVWSLQTGASIRDISWEGDVVEQVKTTINARGTHFAVGGVFPLGPAGPHEVWDLQSGKRTYNGDVPPVTALTLSDDGNYLAVADFERGLEVVDLKNRKRIFETRFTAPIDALAFSADAKLLLSATKEGPEIQCWDLEQKRIMRRFSPHQGFANEMAFLPDGKRFVSVSDDGLAIVSDIRSGKVLNTFRVGNSPAGCLAIDAQFNRLLLGCDDGTVSLWQLPGDNTSVGPVQIIPYDPFLISAGAFSPDGMLAIVGQQESFLVRDNLSGTLLKRLAMPGSETGRYTPVALQFNKDGSEIRSIWATETPVFSTFELPTGKILRKSMSHFGRSPQGAVIAPDGNLALLSGNKVGHEMPLALFATRSKLLRDPAYHFFEGREGEAAPESLVSLIAKEHFVDADGMAFSSDGKLFAFGTKDRLVRLWNTEEEKEIGQFKGHTQPVHAIAFSKDGRYLLSGGEDRELYLWDRKTEEQVRRFKGHNGGVTSVAFFAEDRLLISSSYDQTVRIWDVQTGKEVVVLRGFPYGISNIAIQPDGMRILAVGGDRVGLQIKGAYAVWDFHKSEAMLAVREKREELFNDARSEPIPAETLNRLGQYYAAHDQWDWAADLLRQARQGGASPTSLPIIIGLHRAGRREELNQEIEHAKKALLADPNAPDLEKLSRYLEMWSQAEMPSREKARPKADDE